MSDHDSEHSNDNIHISDDSDNNIVRSFHSGNLGAHLQIECTFVTMVSCI